MNVTPKFCENYESLLRQIIAPIKFLRISSSNPTRGGIPLYSAWFHKVCIHIILHDRVGNIKDQIMQDFAKSRTVAARDSVQPVGEWKIDAGSMLFGVLLGAPRTIPRRNYS